MLKLRAQTLGFGVGFQPRGAQGMSFVPLKMGMGPFLWEAWGGWKNVPIIPAAAPCPSQGQEEEGAARVLPQGIHPEVIEVLSHFWGVWLCCELPTGTLAAARTVLGLGNYPHNYLLRFIIIIFVIIFMWKSEFGM